MYEYKHMKSYAYITSFILMILCSVSILTSCDQESVNDYYPRDFVIFSEAGCDIKNITGTLEECMSQCDEESSCAGFSRDRDLSADDSGECFLKRSLPPSSRNKEDDTWCTYVKLDALPELLQCGVEDSFNSEIEYDSEIESPENGCNTGLTLCEVDGELICTNTMTDLFNCGSCSQECGFDPLSVSVTVCEFGVCQPLELSE